MTTTAQMQAALKRRLQLVSTSIIFSDASLQDELQNAYLWATDIYPFPSIEKGSHTTSDGDFLYDLPSNYKSDSLTRLMIDDKTYDLIDFGDWLEYKQNNPNDTTRLCAVYGRQYFIFPTPAAGKTIYIWGIIQVDALSFPNGTTCFSAAEALGNEAIVGKAASVLLAAKGKVNDSVREEQKAKKILDDMWGNIVERRANFQRKEAPMFDVPDYFAGSSGQASIGNFTNRS